MFHHTLCGHSGGVSQILRRYDGRRSKRLAIAVRPRELRHDYPQSHPSPDRLQRALEERTLVRLTRIRRAVQGRELHVLHVVQDLVAMVASRGWRPFPPPGNYMGELKRPRPRRPWPRRVSPQASWTGAKNVVRGAAGAAVRGDHPLCEGARHRSDRAQGSARADRAGPRVARKRR